MTVSLGGLVAYGQDLQDYKAMFALKDDLKLNKILECAIGPSSLQAELEDNVITCGPLYNINPEELANVINESFGTEAQHLQSQANKNNWEALQSVDEILAARKRALDLFANDIKINGFADTYISAPLDKLPFADSQFDMALCSHWLFYLSNDLSTDFHLAAIKELTRVAKQARIYPLITNKGEMSKHVGPIIAALQQEGYGAEIKAVDYKLQHGENAMLKVWGAECKL